MCFMNDNMRAFMLKLTLWTKLYIYLVLNLCKLLCYSESLIMVHISIFYGRSETDEWKRQKHEYVCVIHSWKHQEKHQS